MLLLRLFIENLVPVFLAAGAGYLLAVRAKVPAQPFSKAAFYIFSPCLIYSLIVKQAIGTADFGRMAGFAVAVAFTLGLVAWIVARLARWPRELTTALILVVLLPNAGNLGLAINLFAFGHEGLAQAGLYFVTAAILSYTAGVVVASWGKKDWATSLRGLGGVPAIWAVILAFVTLWSGLTLPLPLTRGIQILADGSIPLFIVVLGMQLASVRIRGRLGPLLAAVLIRLVASIVVAVGWALVFGLEGAARQAGIFQAAMPTAVITTILAAEYDAEAEFVTTCVFATTLLCPLTLTPLLAWLGAR